LGVARLPGGATVCVTALDDDVLDLAALAESGALAVPGLPPAALARSSLNAFLAGGRRVWSAVRERLAALIAAGDERLTAAAVPRADVELGLPVEVGDFVDFSASLHHARNMARLLRPESDFDEGRWCQFPRGYHGRAGSVVVSGTPVVRPHGHTAAGLVATARLDIEAELGFVVGAGSALGHPVPIAAARDHVAGLVILNDWSARDLQAYEYQPLGPFLGKSFATSMSPWLVTLDALEPYALDGGYEVRLEILLEARGQPAVTISRPSFLSMHWTVGELLAHATVNGASVRTGDVFGCGTVSGNDPQSYGSLIELTSAGDRPLTLPEGTTRTFLEDGDRVTVRAWAGGDGRPLISLGEVAGTVLPARPLEA
jgi:fumarylacetoacetase